MSAGYQEMPNAAPLDERAASIPGHVERIMLRDYSPVNEGFHILYDAAELLRRYRTRISALEAQLAAAAASDAHNADTVWAVAEGEILELRARLAQVEEAA